MWKGYDIRERWQKSENGLDLPKLHRAVHLGFFWVSSVVTGVFCRKADTHFHRVISEVKKPFKALSNFTVSSAVT